jgi:hypothetical protein
MREIYLRVLVACEFSGTVRECFWQRGAWDSWSCDILDTDIPSVFHHKGDVIKILKEDWDLLIAHPPCTYLVTSGNRWFYHPDDADMPFALRRPHPDYPHRWKDRERSIEFVKLLWGQKHIPHICIENPKGILPKHIGRYSQVIHPYEFGHDVSKSTCLWLKGLPNLIPTEYVPPRIVNGQKRWGNQVDASGADKTPPGPDRWRIRSKTYQGIARAMEAQWGHWIENPLIL